MGRALLAQPRVLFYHLRLRDRGRIRQEEGSPVLLIRLFDPTPGAVLDPTSHISIGKATATACEVTPSVKLETYWEYKEFVRGGGYLGDGSW